MWKRAMFAVVCTVLTLGGLGRVHGQTRTAAMIVSSADLSAGFDQAMYDRLVATGYDVTVVASGDVGGSFTIDEANTYSLLLVSESIGSSSADPLIGTTAPVMHNESYGWDNWFLTTGANMHWVDGTAVDIVNGAHPIVQIAAVQVGSLPFFSSSGSWTTDSVSALAPGAELIAQVNDAGTDCAIIFAVDEGAQLVNGNTAPNRIVGFSVPGNVVYDAADMTNAAWALFDATVIWLTRSVLPTVAKAPNPTDGATDVPKDVVLSWGAGESAETHDIYLGTNFTDVNDASRADPRGVLVSQGQDANSYDPDLQEYGTTYYWRVDEVNAPPDSTIFKGPVWRFETEPFAYPAENVVATSNGISDEVSTPQRTVDGSGLNETDQHSIKESDMWLATPVEGEALWIQYEFEKVLKLHELLVWNYNVLFEPVLGFGIKDATIEYSLDGEQWTVLGDAELARATAKADYAANTTVDFGGVPAKYVRLTVNNGYGVLGQYGLSEVRFLYVPAQAREPEPSDGAGGVDVNTALNWRGGREAASHEVYLGTDPDALSLAATVDQVGYTPGNLEFGDTYYWQIVEVNEADETPAWAGDIWTFSTQEYALVDGFETYDDDIDAGTTIFDTWIDGWVNGSGSTVGYFDAPFAEKTIVRSGGQSMPLQYDNTASPFYSEAERVFDSAQNWSVNGADTLVVYFQGVPGPFAELASGKIIMGAAGADIWNAADEFRFAYKPLNGNGSIVAYVESIANTNAWAKGGVMIRETLDAGSTFAAVYSTPGNGCRYQARLTTDVAAVSDTSVATAEQIALLAPQWVKIERIGNDFNGYYSTGGENWTSMSWNPQTIAMTPNVYIGLALTSHAAGVLASAEFTDVATTGDVTGQWAVETIGPAQPDGNGSGSLYVTLEDATGQSATVIHPAGDAAVLLGGWNEWAIPYGDLSGVNLSRVEKMIIGVGSTPSPSAGGAGIVYIDDVGFGRPAQ